ncbi:hypothetical protein GW17_00055083, partial [Ensete ventricosum]
MLVVTGLAVIDRRVVVIIGRRIVLCPFRDDVGRRREQRGGMYETAVGVMRDKRRSRVFHTRSRQNRRSLQRRLERG